MGIISGACGRLAWILILLSALSGPALAAGFSVSPVLVELDSGQRSTVITLSNGGEQTQRIQAEVFRWTRVNGEDVLEPDPRVLLNPPLFELAPGGSQIVRLGFRGGPLPPSERETAFRVFFQEVPRAEDAANTALRMVLRVGVPVFVEPEKPLEDLRWRATLAGEQLNLSLENRGNQRARVAQLRVAQGEAAPQAVDGFNYVFPGESRVWTVPASGMTASAPLRVDALMNQGSVHVELPLQPQ